MLNHVYENEFKLYVNENLQSRDRMSTRTCFEIEAKGYSEMGICYVKNFCAVDPSNLNWNISDDNHNSGWCKKVQLRISVAHVLYRFANAYTSDSPRSKFSFSLLSIVQFLWC